MGKHYLPRPDADLRRWAEQFSQVVAADPGAVGLTQADSDGYAAAAGDFSRALLLATTPATRTSVAVTRKDERRRALVDLTRRLVRVVRCRATGGQLASLGLPVHGPARRAVPAPATRPRVSVVPANGRRALVVTLRDTVHHGPGRPPAVAGATLHVCFGDAPSVASDGWRFEGTTTRTTVRLSFGADAPPFTRVWVTARWLDARLRPGPFANPVDSYVPPGLVTAA